MVRGEGRGLRGEGLAVRVGGALTGGEGRRSCC